MAIGRCWVMRCRDRWGFCQGHRSPFRKVIIALKPRTSYPASLSSLTRSCECLIAFIVITMPSRCVAFGCSCLGQVYGFPENSQLRRIWENYVLTWRADFKAHTYISAKLCFRHFSESQFQNYGQWSSGFCTR